jgi:hypothetical protein
MLALLASHNQQVYRLTFDSADDIADHIRDTHLKTIPAGRFNFWVTPSLRTGDQQLNQPATKILFGTGPFTARSVPLLRGTVVVTAREHDGALRSMSEDEVMLLANFAYELPWPADLAVEWRLHRAARPQKRRHRAEIATANRLPALPVLSSGRRLQRWAVRGTPCERSRRFSAPVQDRLCLDHCRVVGGGCR